MEVAASTSCTPKRSTPWASTDHASNQPGHLSTASCLEKQSTPLGQIDLPITFGDLTNYRMETLTIEVVGFHRTYHAILGCPFYMRFMAIPNYTYLKLKMSGPCGVITIDTSFQPPYECEVECCEDAMAIVVSKELVAIREQIVEERP